MAGEKPVPAMDPAQRLIDAVKAGRRHELSPLLQAGESPEQMANVTDAEGYSLLQRAVIAQDTRTVSLLIEAGAKVNRARIKGDEPLHLALGCERPDMECIKLLVDAGAEVNSRDRLGRAPLDRLAQDEELPLARLLLSAGADPLTGDESGRTALHRIAERDARCKKMLGLFLGNIARHEINTLGSGGSTPLHGAVAKGEVEMAFVIVRAGADPNGMKPIKARADKAYKTPLGKAIEHNRLACVGVLAEAGACPYLHAGDGLNALQLALVRRRHDCLASLFQAPMTSKSEVLDILVGLYMAGSYKMMIKRKDSRPFSAGSKNGRDAFAHRWAEVWDEHKIKADERRELLETTLRSGALDPGACDEDGNTLMHHLCVLGAPVEDLTLLMDHGYDPDARNKRGENPLLCYLGNELAPPTNVGVATLVEGGAEIGAVRTDGRTALDIVGDNPAVKKTMKDFLELLDVENTIKGGMGADTAARRGPESGAADEIALPGQAPPPKR